jgi:hypothetical protein
VSGEVLIELTLAFHVEASEVLLVGVVHVESTQTVEGETTAEVEGCWVLLAVIE